MNSENYSYSKKFNCGEKIHILKPIPEVQKQQEILKQVTVMEIGCAQPQRKPNAWHRFFLRFAASAVFAACCVFIGYASMQLPLPQSVSDFLVPLAEFLLYTDSQTEQHTADIASTPPVYELKLPKETEKPIQDNPSPPQDSDRVETAQVAEKSIALSNETKYSIDMTELLKESYPINALMRHPQENTDAVTVFAQSVPEVLIIHTHGTECYADTPESGYRSTDCNYNVVRAGKELHDTLKTYGVSVLHCTEMFDKDSYIKSYSNSYSAVSEYLSKYPSIKYVIDLHRDAVSDESGNYTRPVTAVDGESAAQLMLVVGTDEAGARHKGWKDNLRTAAGIQKAVDAAYPGLMRNINLRRASFNQQLCNGYFILEAGNCGNTLEEVLVSVRAFGKIFAKTVAPEI